MTDAEVGKLGAVEIVAATVYGEARDQPLEGQVAVACVIRNRVLRPEIPLSYQAVCLKPLQFSCWSSKGGFANYKATVGAATQMVSWRGRVPSDAVKPDQKVMRQCLWIATGVVSGAILDNTKGSDHYYADSIPMPSWAKDMTETVQIGAHRFFRS